MTLDNGIIVFLATLVIGGIGWSVRQASRIQSLEAQVQALLTDIHEFKAASNGFREAVSRIDTRLAVISEQITTLLKRSQ